MQSTFLVRSCFNLSILHWSLHTWTRKFLSSAVNTQISAFQNNFPARWLIFYYSSLTCYWQMSNSLAAQGSAPLLSNSGWTLKESSWFLVSLLPLSPSPFHLDPTAALLPEEVVFWVTVLQTSCSWNSGMWGWCCDVVLSVRGSGRIWVLCHSPTWKFWLRCLRLTVLTSLPRG